MPIIACPVHGALNWKLDCSPGSGILKGKHTRLKSVVEPHTPLGTCPWPADPSLHPSYRAPVHYIKKAQDHSIDSYSAFADNHYHRFTTLNSELSLHGIKTIVVAGLITSACVRGTSIDGIKLGYQVILIEDATESISAEDKAKAIRELENWGRCRPDLRAFMLIVVRGQGANVDPMGSGQFPVASCSLVELHRYVSICVSFQNHVTHNATIMNVLYCGN